MIYTLVKNIIMFFEPNSWDNFFAADSILYGLFKLVFGNK